jgi:hypothetical protein
VDGSSRPETPTPPLTPGDTQVTPQGETIPVPTRGEFDANLDKLLKAPRPPKKVAGRRRAATPKGSAGG